MKVTVQYYDKEAGARNAVADAVKKSGYTVETKDEFFQTIEVPNVHVAKQLMEDMSPIENIQIQTA